MTVETQGDHKKDMPMDIELPKRRRRGKESNWKGGKQRNKKSWGTNRKKRFHGKGKGSSRDPGGVLEESTNVVLTLRGKGKPQSRKKFIKGRNVRAEKGRYE